MAVAHRDPRRVVFVASIALARSSRSPVCRAIHVVIPLLGVIRPRLRLDRKRGRVLLTSRFHFGVNVENGLGWDR